MTQEDFNKLPLLLRRSEVVACGIDEKKIDDITKVLKSDKDAVPFGMIGAVKSCTKGYKKYRKMDLARMCGFRV